jgi:hypothetical protein
VLALIGLLAPAGSHTLLAQLWLGAYLSLLRAAQPFASRELIKIDAAQPQQDGGAKQLSLCSPRPPPPRANTYAYARAIAAKTLRSNCALATFASIK